MGFEWITSDWRTFVWCLALAFSPPCGSRKELRNSQVQVQSAFLVLHLNIAVLLRIYYGQAFLYKHLAVAKLLTRATGWRESECRAPDKSTPVAGDPLKTHQATSGIMRGLSLMCARRKERSDEIAIATKSIASSSPLREQMRGNT